MQFSYKDIEIFVLVFARVSTFIVLTPILGAKGVPAIAKIGLSFLLAILIFPLLPKVSVAAPTKVLPFFLMLGKEVVVGLLLGFITVFIFASVQLAGELIGIQIGFGMANVVDPMSNAQISLIGQFGYFIAAMIFITIDGHLFLISGIRQSFEIVPLFSASFHSMLNQKIITMTGEMFIAAVKIGAPVITTLLLTSISMGILARTVPQMNVFFVALPLKIGIGLFILALSLPIIGHFFNLVFSKFQGDFNLIMRLL